MDIAEKISLTDARITRLDAELPTLYDKPGEAVGVDEHRIALADFFADLPAA